MSTAAEGGSGVQADLGAPLGARLCVAPEQCDGTETQKLPIGNLRYNRLVVNSSIAWLQSFYITLDRFPVHSFRALLSTLLLNTIQSANAKTKGKTSDKAGPLLEVSSKEIHHPTPDGDNRRR